MSGRRLGRDGLVHGLTHRTSPAPAHRPPPPDADVSCRPRRACGPHRPPRANVSPSAPGPRRLSSDTAPAAVPGSALDRWRARRQRVPRNPRCGARSPGFADTSSLSTSHRDPPRSPHPGHVRARAAVPSCRADSRHDLRAVPQHIPAHHPHATHRCLHTQKRALRTLVLGHTENTAAHDLLSGFGLVRPAHREHSRPEPSPHRG